MKFCESESEIFESDEQSSNISDNYFYMNHRTL